MLQNSHNNPHLPQMPRVKQISSYHCGPAVLKMLLGFHGVKAYQRDISTAAGIEHSIKTYGITIPQMAAVVQKLAPQFQFWYKADASLKDLQEIITVHSHPVGVEWQGVFEELADEDNGHYAVITHIDISDNVVMIADPFGRYAGTDRRFGVLEFERRWWDTNEIIDQRTHHHDKVLDYHMMFIVTDFHATFPEELGMTQG